MQWDNYTYPWDNSTDTWDVSIIPLTEAVALSESNDFAAHIDFTFDDLLHVVAQHDPLARIAEMFAETFSPHDSTAFRFKWSLDEGTATTWNYNGASTTNWSYDEARSSDWSLS